MYDARKYNPENKSVRSVQEIRDGLINHPSNAGRKEELTLLIDWLLAKERHNNEKGRAILNAFEEKMAGEQSPSLRALTLIAEAEGEDVQFRTISDFERLMTVPAEDQIRFDEERLAVLKVMPLISRIPLGINFENLLEVFEANAEPKPQDPAMDFIETHFVSTRPSYVPRLS